MKSNKQVDLKDIQEMIDIANMPKFGSKEFNKLCEKFFSGKSLN